MLRAFFVIVLLPLLLSAQSDHLKILRSKTETRLQEIAARSTGVLGYSILDLATGERFELNPHLVFPQGSAIKIPIMMEVFKQAQEGKLKLTDRLWVLKRQQVGGSGVLKELGDSASHMSVRDLVVLMILVSDNTATNMLIDLVGMNNINRTMASLGLKQTRVQRRMIDQAASARGDENLSTPSEAARIMEILYRGEFLSRSACDDMLEILQKPKRGAINAALPAGIPVAFKPGGIAGVTTEWALVYLKNRPYVVTVMENYAVEGEPGNHFEELSRAAYQYFSRLARATGHGTYVEPELMRK